MLSAVQLATVTAPSVAWAQAQPVPYPPLPPPVPYGEPAPPPGATVQRAPAVGQDVIYMKNGGLLRGTIIAAIPDAQARIQLATGDWLTTYGAASAPAPILETSYPACASCYIKLFATIGQSHLLVEGVEVRIGSPKQAKNERLGMALIPEDRKTEGLMLPMSVGANLSFAALEDYSNLGFIDGSVEASAIDKMIAALARVAIASSSCCASATASGRASMPPSTTSG